MDFIRTKMTPGFQTVEGGLFSSVSKADVGNVAQAMEAQGVAMLSWADPFMPDDKMPSHVREALLQYNASAQAMHYTAPVGNTALKQAIAKKLLRQNGLQADPERNILITPGSDAGLLFAMMPFINAGDEVLVPDPSYPSNFLNPQLLGGKTVCVPLQEEKGFALDISAWEARVTPRTKMVLLTNPNNPTGTVFSKEELTELAQFVQRHDLVLVVDQAFEDFIYDGHEMVTMAALPGMWERTVTVFSISKGMALSGLRVGYLVADAALMDVYYGSAVNVVGATNTAAQYAALAAFEDSSFMQQYCDVFERRRHHVAQALNSVPGVSMQLPQSAFLSWVNVSQLGNAAEIAAYLQQTAKVCVNDGTVYGPQNGPGHLRIVHGCYADDAILYDAIERIRAALMQLAREKGLAE